MEQRIRYLQIAGRRVAYATMGRGPALLFPPGWFAQLDVELESEPLRSFYEVFASSLTLIRYDRPGTGLSDRERPPHSLTLEAEVDVAEAVIDALNLDRCSFFGFSYGVCIAAAFAARRPERTGQLVLYGGYADGNALAAPPVRASLTAMLRAHWGLGSRLMTQMFIPDGDPEVVRWFTRLQREACTGDMAADLLEMVYRADLRDALGSLLAPVLVLHRRHDRVIPYQSGRNLAALIPGARLVTLEGRWHQPWLGDAGAVLRPSCRFLDIPAPARYAAGDAQTQESAGLTKREVDVLHLVAEGLSDREIAAKLVLSPHTVHRHIANVRTRLGYSSRAAAAAYATRMGLI